MGADLARAQPGSLKPRAVAVLVALRRGPLSTLQLRNAIGDDNTAVTQSLLADMLTDTIDHRPGDPVRWYLTHDGVGWLETNGLSADQCARIHTA